MSRTSRIISKMTLQELIEIVEFCQKWFLFDDTEIQRRKRLILESIEDNKFIHKLSDNYYNNKIISSFVKHVHIMAHLKPIKDKMLEDYIYGLSMWGLNFRDKEKRVTEAIDRLMLPAVDTFGDFFKEEAWQDFLIYSEVVEGEICNVNSMVIPFTFEAIKNHVTRMRLSQLFPGDIGKVKSHYQKYNEQLYGVETPINNNLVKGKDDKLTTTSSAKDNEIDHSKLLDALSKYISGIRAVEFTNIIEHHSLTQGTPKAIWKGIPADAHRFATFLEMKLPAFNKCFSLSIGRKLKHNDKNETNSPIIAILEAHKKK